MTAPHSTRLCIVRHGETAWNAEHRVQGQLDVPLNAVGFAQARAAATVLGGAGFDAVYSSDLARARQTAQPAAERLSLQVLLERDLRERNYGIFERLTYSEVKERFPADYARFLAREPDYEFSSGESLRAFHERSMACLRRIAAAHPGGEVLVFTHGGVLDNLYRAATGMSISAPRDFRIPNCGINRVEGGAEGWRILSWAEERHLDGALDDN
ncbi:MAG: histidine phosphatase family protein [Burkholderiales bacterium]|nr:histidine phosphatase family protein [Burkholderiales bacterium]